MEHKCQGGHLGVGAMLGGGWVHEETQGLVPGLCTVWSEGKGHSTNGTNQQQSIS